MTLVRRITEWGLPGEETCRPACVETFEAKSLQLNAYGLLPCAHRA